jgi:phosphate/sulfate permease
MSDIFPCLGIVGSLAVIFGFLAFLRYMKYKETIALAEKGLTAPPESRSNKTLLRWGIVITALGLALTIGLYAIGFNSANNYPLHLGPWMLGGLVPLFLGLGLVLLHYLTEKE